MKTLQQRIQEKSFDYVNSDITEENFPLPTIEQDVEYELVHFDKNISNEDAITELSKDGWKPATLYDLLNWTDWNGKDWVAVLGSVAEVGGDRYVPFLNEDGSRRNLILFWFEDGWGSRYRFLRVRNLDTQSLVTPALGHSEPLTLEKAVDFIKSLGWTITLTK